MDTLKDFMFNLEENIGLECREVAKKVIHNLTEAILYYPTNAILWIDCRLLDWRIALSLPDESIKEDIIDHSCAIAFKTRALPNGKTEAFISRDMSVLMVRRLQEILDSYPDLSADISGADESRMIIMARLP